MSLSQTHNDTTMYESRSVLLLHHIPSGNQIVPMLPRTQLVNEFVSARLEVALEFILRNTNQKITIEDIAAEAALSKFHLIRSFKTQFGITPFKLHLELKIDYAKAMLINHPRMKVKDIAISIGYSDIFAFSKHFKKATGYSPRTFQKKFAHDYNSKVLFNEQLMEAS